jgi:hypothetical protein
MATKTKPKARAKGSKKASKSVKAEPGFKPLEITLDSKLSYMINSTHPVIADLKKLSNEGMVRLHTFDSSNERIPGLDIKEFRKLLKVTYPQGSPRTLDDHSDIWLLTDHKAAGRDYFITLNSENILKHEEKLGRLGISVRPPGRFFLRELKNRLEKSFVEHHEREQA